MNRINLRMAAIALGVSAALSGCSYVASLFPDKQKQYKYSTEIPPLEIPPDLIGSTIEGATTRRAAVENRTPDMEPEPEARPSRRETESRQAASDDEDDEDETTASPAPKRPETHQPAVASTLAQSSDDVPLIEVEEPYAEAWNDVAKAIGRLKLELNDQNRTDGLFYVYFSQDEKPHEDKGFFSDMAAFFSKGPGHAKEYQVKLEGKGDLTYVFVLGQAGKPETEGEGLELLKRLHKALQSLSEPPKGENP